jgi:hypothetical protein
MMSLGRRLIRSVVRPRRLGRCLVLRTSNRPPLRLLTLHSRRGIPVRLAPLLRARVTALILTRPRNTLPLISAILRESRYR